MWDFIKLVRGYGIIVSSQVPEDQIYVWHDTRLLEINPKDYNKVYVIKYSKLMRAMVPVDEDE